MVCDDNVIELVSKLYEVYFVRFGSLRFRFGVCEAELVLRDTEASRILLPLAMLEDITSEGGYDECKRRISGTGRIHVIHDGHSLVVGSDDVAAAP